MRNATVMQKAKNIQVHLPLTDNETGTNYPSITVNIGRPVYCAAKAAAMETTFDRAYPFARSGAGNLKVSRVKRTDMQFCRKHVYHGREERDPQGPLNCR